MGTGPRDMETEEGGARSAHDFLSIHSAHPPGQGHLGDRVSRRKQGKGDHRIAAGIWDVSELCP